MPLIPPEALPYFENMIYLPMILTVLERDRELVEKGPFKLKGPYMIDRAVKHARAELKRTKLYLQLLTIVSRHSSSTFTGLCP